MTSYNVCSVSECSKQINRDNLCLRHKLLKVNVATVPGGARDARTNISYGREVEHNLTRYEERKAAGEKPSGTTRAAREKDSYKQHLWDKHGANLAEENPPEKVREIRKNLLND